MLTLHYVEQLRINHLETETIDELSLNIARETDAKGRRLWLNRPGNWVIREGATGTDCRFTSIGMANR